MYRLLMAIRPEALPTDTAALTEMVLALDAENEKLRVAMQTLKEMIFGKRSERLAAIVAEQFALDLGDLETGVTPLAANDDAPAAKPSGKAPRKKARRNIGALPKHLPRCEQVLEPDTTACPCCRGELHKIGADVSEVLDVIPAILRVLRTIRPKYGCRSAAAPDRERHGLDGARDPRGGLEVRLVSAAVPAGADSGWPRHPSRPGNACRLGEACGLVAQKPL
jgi:transposase